MKEKLRNFMVGRYGVDPLNRFLLVISISLFILSLFLRNGICQWLAMAVMIWVYIRMLSRNHGNRYKENNLYLKYKEMILRTFKREQNYNQSDKTHHIFQCPSCKQKIRVPRGKGKILITCPKCHKEFRKNSR